MPIEQIDTLNQFEQLRNEWETLFARDPQAHIFVSWPWLLGWFRATPHRWFVLAYRTPEDGRLLALLPLAWKQNSLGAVLQAGAAELADYAGMLCHAGADDQVLPAMADHLSQRVRWDRLLMADMMDARLVRLMEMVQGVHQCEAQETPCPEIDLAQSTWDDYLQAQTSRNTRSKLRRFERKLAGMDGFQAVDTARDNFDPQSQALFSLWQQRWGLPLYGHVQVFDACLTHEILWLRVFWQHDRPLAAMAGLLDRPHKTFSYFISGTEAEMNDLNLGHLIVGSSIRYAIEQGCRRYDFLRGDEPYKFSFGATVRAAQSRTLYAERAPSRITNALAHGLDNLRKLKKRYAGQEG